MRFDSSGIVALVHQWAKQNPSSIAAYSREQTLSYKDLEARSELLAAALQARGVSEGSVVGVCVRPGFDILIALIAIFRCEAVYVPLDPEHPAAHIQRILKEAAPLVVVTQRSQSARGFFSAHPSLFVDDLDWLAPPDPNFVGTESSEGPAVSAKRAEEPAYVMFTSGTTGQPKGVAISNSNLHHFLSVAQQTFLFRSQDIFCNVARYTFSISLFDLLIPLCVGAAVRLLDRDEILDLSQLTRHLSKSTVFHAGPSLLSALFRHLRRLGEPTCATLRHVSTGGDLVLPVVMEGMKQHFPHADVFVLYGTTEVSCMGTYFQIPREEKVPTLLVGRPFPQVGLLLLHEDGSPAQVGEVAEICFSGEGVGLGYIGLDQRSEPKFIQRDQQRIYHTGDYGRIFADGSLEIIGRRDFQVQVRGIRLELSAIENQLIELGLANQCVVIYRKDGGSRDAEDSGYLVAFLTATLAIDPLSIRAQLAEHIPAEMIPSRFVQLDVMPLTFNNKLDRKKLIDYPIPQDEEREAKTERQGQIAEIMKAALRIATIGLDQNFFALGGHSLLAVYVLGELNEKLGVRVSAHQFFENPTVRGLASASAGVSASVSPCKLLALNAVQAEAEKKIFFISGVHIYRSLAETLEKKWSVIGVISEREIEANGEGLAAMTMEELARDYAQAILQSQKQGPYYILGYSFAGILAYEVSKQIREMGGEVARLFLVDSLLPEGVFRWQHGLSQLSRALQTRPSDLLAYLLRKLRKKVSKSKSSVSDSFPYSHIEKARGQRNAELAKSYIKRMTPYDGDTVLFVAGKRLKQKPLQSQSCGWSAYLNKVTVVRIDADHLTLMEDKLSLQKIVQTALLAGRNFE